MSERPFTFHRTFSAAAVIAMLWTPAQANVFGDLAGIVTDPLKLGKFSDKFQDTIQSALIQINQLEARGDQDAQQLLAQLKDIVVFAIQNGEGVEAQAFTRLNALEARIDSDAVQLIYRAECAGEVLLNDRVQQAIVSATENLAKANPTILLFGIPILSFRSKPVSIDDPYRAYLDTKTAVLDHLNSTTKDDTPAYLIVTTYQNLERLAKLVECNYLDQTNSVYILQDVADYERLSTPWTQVVFASHP